MSLFDRVVVGLLPHVPRPWVRHFSRPYIAGTSLDDAIALIRRLNEQGMRATLDILGEHIQSIVQSEAPRDAYLEVLAELKRTGVNSNVSVKLTQLGLAIDAERCYTHIRSLVARAREVDNFVRIDMEDSSCTDPTLGIYRRLRHEFDNVGIVLQSMLRRTEGDAVALSDLRPNVRVCKGIYVEPERIAYRRRDEVNASYLRTVERLLDQGSYVGLATHDSDLVEALLGIIDARGLPRTAYEFQMLLGVQEGLRDQIVAAGHPLRVYVPFGEQWYAYSLRRMRENPKIAGYVARSVFQTPFG